MATVTNLEPSFDRDESQRRVRHPLHRLRSYIRAYVTAEGLAILGIYAALWFWIGLLLDFGFFKAFGIDWVQVAPWGLRAVALAGLLTGLVAVVASKVLFRLLREFRDDALALLLERRFPMLLGDRLITAVEMADLRLAKRYGYSQPMIDETVRDAALRVDRLDPAEVFNWRRLRHYGLFLALITLGSFLLLGSIYCLATRTRVADYLGGFQNVASIWFERNILLANTIWPRKAYLELVNFPASGDLRVGRSASPPALHVRALKWVIADATAPEGWRALRWTDLSPKLLGMDTASLPLPPSWRPWTVDQIEAQLETAALDADAAQSLREVFDRLEEKTASFAMARRLRKLVIPNQVVVYYRGETVRSEQTLKKQADNEYSGVLSDLKESVRFTANGEDYYTPYKKITLVPPPGLVELICDEERPAYLSQRPPAGGQPADLKGKKQIVKDLPVSLASSASIIEVAAGTNVVLHGKTDKRLRAVDGIRMRPHEGSGPIHSPIAAKDAQTFEVRFENIMVPLDFDFEFTDTDEVVGRRHVMIKPIEDLPPDVDTVLEVLRKTSQGYLATPSAKIPFSGKVRDDHGLSEVAYAYMLISLDAQKLAALRPAVSAMQWSPRGLVPDLLAAAYLAWLSTAAGPAADEANLPVEKKLLTTFRRAARELDAQDKPQEKSITNLTLDPDEESFDVAPLGLKVSDEQQLQTRYRMRLWVEAQDNNVETGPGIGRSKEKFTVLLIPENELLVEIAKEEESLHVKLEDTVNKLRDARTKLEQVIQELPGLRAAEFSPMALRADEMKGTIERSWDVSREVFSDYRRILKELQVNRVRPKIIEKVERNICEPLDLAVSQDFVRSLESMTAFQKILDQEKKANLEAANLARLHLDQLINRLTRVLDAMGDITTINKLIEQLVRIEKAERNAYEHFKDISDKLQDQLLEDALPSEPKPQEKKK